MVGFFYMYNNVLCIDLYILNMYWFSLVNMAARENYFPLRRPLSAFSEMSQSVLSGLLIYCIYM